MRNRFVHVVHRGGDWAVEEAGAEQPVAFFQTLTLAVNAGRELATANRVELIVRRKDGTIGQRFNYVDNTLALAC
ncbi:MAG: DUF2188 domain-containing protein [Cyanobacteria bacterium]|nr:DUF2188 domain-containing protein [Cyanobacteriota bacterium]